MRFLALPFVKRGWEGERSEGAGRKMRKNDGVKEERYVVLNPLRAKMVRRRNDGVRSFIITLSMILFPHHGQTPKT